MERYAPNAKDLASRDVVSRSMTIEIREGRCVHMCGYLFFFFKFPFLNTFWHLQGCWSRKGPCVPPAPPPPSPAAGL